MKYTNLEIQTYPFKKTPPRSKDNLYQIKIRVRIGDLINGRFKEYYRYEVTALDMSQHILRMSASDFDGLKANKDLYSHITQTEYAIKREVRKLILQDEKISARKIFENVYAEPESKNQIEAYEPEEELIYDEFVRRFFEYPITREVYDEFLKETELADINATETLTADDIETIAGGIEMIVMEKKHKQMLANMDFEERYRTGLFNKDSIYEVFGYCWATNKNTGEPYVPTSYKALILRLNDYRFVANPPSNIKDFGFQWIDDFLSFLSQNGYADIRLRGYDPFNIEQFKNDIRNAKRKNYDAQSFKKILKHTKRYVEILQNKGLLSHDINTKSIISSDYISRKVQDENYTRQFHSLTVEEFNTFASKDFEDDKFNLARDMFVLAVLGGGLRTEELFDKSLKVIDNQIYIYRTKGKKITTNPIVFPQLISVIEKHKGIPKMLKKNEYLSTLKVLAKILGFDRGIPCPNTKLNESKGEIEYKPLYELFANYFARKTIVTILGNLDLRDEQIANYTAHADLRTLKHYKAPLTSAQKKKLLGEKITLQELT